MDLHTSYRDTYVPLKPASARDAKKNDFNEEKVYTRRPMNAISQTSLDFPAYPNHRPPSPAEMEPFVSQITIGNSFTPSVTLVFLFYTYQFPFKYKLVFFLGKVNIVRIMKVLIQRNIIVHHL